MSRMPGHLLLGGDAKVALSLREKKAVIRELASHYRRAKKKEKARLLDYVVSLTAYNRTYAARILRRPLGAAPSSQRRGRGGGRKRLYDERVIKALTKVWAILDFPAGKRLAPLLPELVTTLERFHELRLDDETRKKLVSISAATIDRLLTPERKQLQIKGRSGTKPGTLLKHEIPIRTFAEWNAAQPGFLEMDLVSHDGGRTQGDYAQTLDTVDIATGWTETAAVKNKAQRWVFEALQEIIARLPFPVQGIDSDNGAEFINDQLVRYCRANRITFTRSRPYRKNDSCHVEQKNWSVVRKNVGYLRYDQPHQVALLNQLYQTLRLYTNHFQPMMKLISKERNGARVKRTYDLAQTPYQRALSSPHVEDDAKARLQAEHLTLNPAELKRQLHQLQQQLITSVTTLNRPRLDPKRD